MTFDQQLLQNLLGDPSIRGVVEERIYNGQPDYNPEAPFIVFVEVGGEPLATHDSLGDDAVDKTYQITCWAKTPDVAKTLRQLVVTRIGTLYNDARLSEVSGLVRDPVAKLYNAYTSFLLLTTL